MKEFIYDFVWMFAACICVAIAIVPVKIAEALWGDIGLLTVLLTVPLSAATLIAVLGFLNGRR